MIYFIVGFICCFVCFTTFIYFYRKKTYNDIVNFLKVNSDNYLKCVISMANRKKFKFKHILTIIQSKFEKNNKEIGNLNIENSFLKDLLDIIDEGILKLGKENEIIYVNKSFLKMFNFVKEDIMGKSIEETELSYILDYESLKSFEIDNISCSFFKLPNFKVYKFKNVSEVKKLEHMSKEFISNVTHELKTPLTSIIGFSETLKNVENEHDRQIFYDIINKEAIRLNNLISDVLTFSEIESQNTMNKQKVDVKALLKHICKVLNPQLSKTNFKVLLSGDSLTVLSCEKYLHQIFINIIDNAIKHSFGTHLKIELYEDEKNAYIKFIDDGVGIPKEDFKNIFDRFYKVQQSKSKSKGTGLGLSIVKTCINKINGNINVFNNIDKGTTFEVSIPKR